MPNESEFRTKVLYLYQKHPLVHVSISMTKPRTAIKNISARIIGVYPNLFQIEETDDPRIPRKHTFQYTDLITGRVAIEEMARLKRVAHEEAEQ